MGYDMPITENSTILGLECRYTDNNKKETLATLIFDIKPMANDGVPPKETEGKINKVEDAMKLTVTPSFVEENTSSLSMEVEIIQNKIIDTGFDASDIKCLIYWTDSDKGKGDFFAYQTLENVDSSYGVNLKEAY